MTFSVETEKSQQWCGWPPSQTESHVSVSQSSDRGQTKGGGGHQCLVSENSPDKSGSHVGAGLLEEGLNIPVWLIFIGWNPESRHYNITALVEMITDRDHTGAPFGWSKASVSTVHCLTVWANNNIVVYEQCFLTSPQLHVENTSL